jgi:hypothetical protein
MRCQAAPRHPSSLLLTTTRLGDVAATKAVYLNLAVAFVTPCGARGHRENCSVTLYAYAYVCGNVHNRGDKFVFISITTQ